MLLLDCVRKMYSNISIFKVISIIIERNVNNLHNYITFKPVGGKISINSCEGRKEGKKK